MVNNIYLVYIYSLYGYIYIWFTYLIRAFAMSNNFARQYSRNEAITFDWICRHVGWPFNPPQTILDLVHLESVFDILDLYLWLSYRFQDLFPDPTVIRGTQKELDKIIQLGVFNITRLLKNSEGDVGAQVGVGGSTTTTTTTTGMTGISNSIINNSDYRNKTMEENIESGWSPGKAFPIPRKKRHFLRGMPRLKKTKSDSIED